MQMFTHVKIVTGFMDKHLGQENNKIRAVKGVGCSSMLPAPLHYAPPLFNIDQPHCH